MLSSHPHSSDLSKSLLEHQSADVPKIAFILNLVRLEEVDFKVPFQSYSCTIERAL